MRFFEALKNLFGKHFQKCHILYGMKFTSSKMKTCLRKQVKSCKSMFTLMTCPGCIPSLSLYASWDRLQQTHDPERIRGREQMDRYLHLKVCIFYEYLYGVFSVVNWSPCWLNRKGGRTSQASAVNLSASSDASVSKRAISSRYLSGQSATRRLLIKVCTEVCSLW